MRIATTFALGNALGGIASAWIIMIAGGLLAGIPAVSRVVFLTLPLTVVLGLDIVGRLDLVPQRKRQIGIEVFQAGIAAGGFRFGAEYGTGARTHLSSATPYILVWALLVANADFLLALTAGIGFGIGRALPVGMHVLLQSDSWDSRTDASARLVGFLCMGLSMLSAVGAATVLL
jgi:hypothetical protein